MLQRSLALTAAGAVLAGVAYWVLAPLPAADKLQPRKTFHDPAPPKLRDLSSSTPPPAHPNPAVTFHQPPKPLAAGALTHDWTSFLGPAHNATSTETKLLKTFPESGPPLVWEMRKGTGYASPAISGDRLVFLHRLGNHEEVLCLRSGTGELYWRFRYPTDFRDRFGYNNGPRASPVIDGDRVYTFGSQGQLHCLRLATGEVLWKRDISAEFKVNQDFFGTTSTPLIEGDHLIVNVGAPGGPTVAAFDKRNGKMVWGAGRQWGPSYASPVPAVVHGKRRIFVFAGGESRPPTGGLLVIDPLDGRIDFTFPWRSRDYESVNASTPTVIGNQVLLSASYGTGAVLLNILANGSRDVAWANFEFDLHFTTAVHQDGYIYAFDGRNEPDAALMCVERKTGKTIWRKVPEWKETVEIRGTMRTLDETTYRGSLLQVDGRFLAVGERGHLLWLDLSPKGYRVTSRARLFYAKETWGLPVLSRGLLYMTQNRPEFVPGDAPPRLLCYDLRGD